MHKYILQTMSYLIYILCIRYILFCILDCHWSKNMYIIIMKICVAFLFITFFPVLFLRSIGNGLSNLYPRVPTFLTYLFCIYWFPFLIKIICIYMYICVIHAQIGGRGKTALGLHCFLTDEYKWRLTWWSCYEHMFKCTQIVLVNITKID